MAEKRSDTAHRTPSQIREHTRIYGAQPEQVHNRVLRNAARREAIRDGRVEKNDGKEINHKVPLSKGGSNAKSNTEVTSRSKNRAHGLTDGDKPNSNKGK